MLSTLATIFGGPVGGVVTGIFGSLFSNIFNYFKQKQAHKQKMELKELEIKADRQDHIYAMAEADMNMQIKKSEIEGAINLKEAESFMQSQKNAMVSLFKASFMTKMMEVEGWPRYFTIPIATIVAFAFGLVDFIKHLMRPGITIFLIIVFGKILTEALGILKVSNHQWTVEQAVKIVMLSVDAAIYLTVTCVSWWFSDRRIAKFMMRLNDGNLKN